MARVQGAFPGPGSSLAAATGGFAPTTDGRFSTTGGAFRPDRRAARSIEALAPSRFGGTLEVTAAGNADVRVTLRPLSGSPAPGELDQGRLVYRGAYEDADAIVAATDDRVEEHVVLRSPRAPRELIYEVTLGAALVGHAPGSQGSIALRDASGRTRLRFTPAVAVDARGVRRVASQTLAKGRLVVHLDTRGLTYPVLLDPGVETPLWEERVPDSPSARAHFGIAYDAARNKSVVFGGGWPFPTGDTWEWDGATRTWANRTPAISPPARTYTAMAYDPIRKTVLLFGGWDGSNALRDTWIWDGATGQWTAVPLSAAASPPARTGHSLTWDGTNIVLFGGNASTLLGDTWLWDGAAQTWTKVTPATSPWPRYGHATTYDSVRNEVLLFGSLSWDKDTWVWSGPARTWTRKSAVMPGCNYATLAFDPGRGGRAVMFGCAYEETWEWDGVDWTLRNPPVSPINRVATGMTFDPLRGRVFLFGGTANGQMQRDMWEWDGTSGTWSQPRPTPPARLETAMVYDEIRQRMLLFGGRVGGDTTFSDTWEYDGATAEWADRTPALVPASRRGHALVFDPTRGTVLLFGGTNLGGLLQDTWEWDGATGVWAQRVPAHRPPPRWRHRMAFDRARQRAVLFGGLSTGGGSYLQDTWEWNPATGDWTDVTPATGSPSGREQAELLYDDDLQRVVLFGGFAYPGVGRFDDTWTWDGANWAQLAPTVHPPVLTGHSFAFDASRKRGVLFGGSDYYGALLQDTWEWNGRVREWSRRTPALAPTARGSAAFAYDAGRARMVLFSGHDGASERLDTWEYAVYNLADGLPCASAFATRCGSGFCVDGVCCAASACPGTCRACNVPGAEGHCANVLPGSADPDTCTGAQACDGAGTCELANGQPCGSDAVCGSGHCADGVCCDAACADTCKACNLTGRIGRCSLIAAFARDPAAALPCVAPHSCDGAGACKLDTAQPCGAAAECTSGHCVDGRCCADACTAQCWGCAVAGHEGACTLLPLQTADVFATATCTDANACDGAGGCRLKNGQGCSAGAQCASDICDDGVCCNAVCDGTCLSCDLAASTGTCTLVPAGQPDPTGPTPCIGGYLCNGSGACKQGQGRPCTKGSDCGSNFCVDGVCCDSACDAPCKTCATGTCSDVARFAEDPGTCVAPHQCDGDGACKRAAGQTCASAQDCASAMCVDGRCCSEACTAQCFGCAVAGHEGACHLLPAGTDDLLPTNLCSANNTCNGAGACLLKNGMVCSSAAQCASNNCVDGVCCDSPCTGQCRSCNVLGHLGACFAVPAGQADTTGPITCVGDHVCDGAGACKPGPGQPCSSASECGSGFCVDHACCDSACLGTCRTCASGQCSFVARSSEDPDTCTAPQACDGSGGCRRRNGETCALGSDCASGFCVEGVCCESDCRGTCLSCGLAASRGLCRPLPTGSEDDYPSGACAGLSACDGAGTCRKRNGQGCAVGGECASGYCADAICCDHACTSPCFACNLANNVGRCSPVAAGEHHAGACSAGSVPCNQACDGKGNCVFAATTTACGASTQVCSQGALRRADHCDGQGGCSSGASVSCGGYECLDGTSCRTSCSIDDHCAPGFHCQAGVCIGQKPKGSPCALNSECTSGACADGVCCTTVCTGACARCDLVGQEGNCLPLPDGQDPDHECGGTGACQGVCNGAGACRYPASGALCGAATCSANSFTPAPGCDGRGTCVAAGATPCAPYQCRADGCLSACRIDGDCATGFYCQGSVCLPLRGKGQSCTADGQCSTGVCADGVCCDGACSGTCLRCDLSGSQGTCSPVPNGEDPQDECAGSGACGGVCSGAGACRTPSQGTPCGTAGCANGVLQTGATCDGLGNCQASVVRDCGGYGCAPDGTECLSACAAHGDCVSGFHCEAPACVADRKLGARCSLDIECASGHCADGLCCASACTGPCARCDLAGSEGTCVNFTVGTDPDGECGGQGVCTGTCDGAGGCAYPDATHVCAERTCVADVFQPTAHCDGRGGCQQPSLVACEGFACRPDASGCLTFCNLDTDCQPAFSCRGNACVPDASNGQACASDSQCQSDHCVDGVCCDRACTGDCETCSSGACLPAEPGTDPRGRCVAAEGGHPRCAGTCGPGGTCVLPDRGTRCGLCQACDGVGRCNVMPPDDPDCGPIDCSGLDTACRVYEALVSHRCESQGFCKAPNDPAACSRWTDLPCSDAGAPPVGTDASIADDASLSADAAPPASSDAGSVSSGGGCASVPGPTAPAPGVTLLIFLAWAATRRRS